jgi:hypothetical protein
MSKSTKSNAEDNCNALNAEGDQTFGSQTIVCELK